MTGPLLWKDEIVGYGHHREWLLDDIDVAFDQLERGELAYLQLEVERTQALYCDWMRNDGTLHIDGIYYWPTGDKP
jgi:hypothetical protein